MSDEPKTLDEVEPEKAAEILSEDGNQRGIVCLWGDKRISVCAGDAEGKGACYTSEKPEGETLYYLAQAFYSYLGHKIKPIEV